MTEPKLEFHFEGEGAEEAADEIKRILEEEFDENVGIVRKRSHP